MLEKYSNAEYHIDHVARWAYGCYMEVELSLDPSRTALAWWRWSQGLQVVKSWQSGVEK